jgi:curved DNA-binding protein
MAHKDYYKILGLSKNASTDAIKRAYRKLAMQYHPDRNNGREKWANDKFKEINEAFSVLGDPKKRMQYDHFGTAGNNNDIFSSQATRATFEDLMEDFGGAGLGFDSLDNIFGDNFRGRRFTFQTFRKGFSDPGDLRFDTRGGINFEDLFEQARSPIVSSVNYEIVLSKEQACQGMEKELVRRGKRLKVKIPAGIKMGSRIRLRNALKATDGQPGDIIISIKVN